MSMNGAATGRWITSSGNGPRDCCYCGCIYLIFGRTALQKLPKRKLLHSLNSISTTLHDIGVRHAFSVWTLSASSSQCVYAEIAYSVWLPYGVACIGQGLFYLMQVIERADLVNRSHQRGLAHRADSHSGIGTVVVLIKQATSGFKSQLPNHGFKYHLPGVVV